MRSTTGKTSNHNVECHFKNDLAFLHQVDFLTNQVRHLIFIYLVVVSYHFVNMYFRSWNQIVV